MLGPAQKSQHVKDPRFTAAFHVPARYSLPPYEQIAGNRAL